MPLGQSLGRNLGRSLGRVGAGRVALALLLGAAVVALLLLRYKIIGTWRAPAGDGVGYYQLAQELRLHGRFAFGPPPTPLSHARLPGYPLFLAYVAAPRAPIGLGQHLFLAVPWNVWLDLGSALLVALIVAQLGLPLAGGALALLAVMLCPILVFLSCYGLTESLATFLATLQLYLVVRALRRPQAGLAVAIAAGVVTGLAQLVRIDAVAMLPVCLLALGLGAAPLRTRVKRVAAFALAALVVFAPWPVRNLRQFGQPHLFGTTWLRQDGTPMPLGMLRWMRTWGTGEPGQSFLIFLAANNLPFDPERPGVMTRPMFDDEDERRRIADIFRRQTVERMSPAVDAAYNALAEERTRRAPFRTFVTLPLRRLHNLWQPMPEADLPMRVPFLGLPDRRAQYGETEQRLWVVCLVGGLLLLRRRETRGYVGLVLVAVVTRCLIHIYAHPFPVQRYLAESVPAMLSLLAGWATLGTALRGQPAAQAAEPPPR